MPALGLRRELLDRRGGGRRGGVRRRRPRAPRTPRGAVPRRRRRRTGGGGRFRLLETLRRYALERLNERAGSPVPGAEEPAATARRRHAAHFLAVAEEAAQRLHGPEQARWLERLDVEHDDLRQALRWALDTGARDTGLRLAGALWWYWATRGRFGEGQRWLEAVLAGGSGPPPAPVLEAAALRGLGHLAAAGGDYGRARTALERALALSQDDGDEGGAASGPDPAGRPGPQPGRVRRRDRAPRPRPRRDAPPRRFPWRRRLARASRRAGPRARRLRRRLGAPRGEPRRVAVPGRPLGHGLRPRSPRRPGPRPGRPRPGGRAARGGAGHPARPGRPRRPGRYAEQPGRRGPRAGGLPSGRGARR